MRYQGDEKKKCREIDRQEQVKKYTKDLVSLSKGEIKYLEIIPSAEINVEQKTKGETKETIYSRISPGSFACFSLFVNSEAYSLAKFSFMPFFCIQHAYNYKKTGFVADSAEKKVNAETQLLMLLQLKSERPDYKKASPIIKNIEVEKVISSLLYSRRKTCNFRKLGLNHSSMGPKKRQLHKTTDRSQ